MRVFRMILMFLVCLVPSFWVAGLTWLALHKNWFESDASIVWMIGALILAAVQIAFVIAFMAIMEKDESTTHKQ